MGFLPRPPWQPEESKMLRVLLLAVTMMTASAFVSQGLTGSWNARGLTRGSSRCVGGRGLCMKLDDGKYTVIKPPEDDPNGTPNRKMRRQQKKTKGFGPPDLSKPAVKKTNPKSSKTMPPQSSSSSASKVDLAPDADKGLFPGG